MSIYMYMNTTNTLPGLVAMLKVPRVVVRLSKECSFFVLACFRLEAGKRRSISFVTHVAAV